MISAMAMNKECTEPIRISDDSVEDEFLALARDLCSDTSNLEFYAADGVLMVVEVLREDGKVKQVIALGCGVCLGKDTVARDEDGIRRLGECEVVPLTAICEDDSRNPVIDAIFLCPYCGHALVDREQLASGVIGVEIDTDV